MPNNDEIRWQQRLDHLQKAFTELDEACAQTTYNKLERAGVIQLFELTFELAWKTLQDLLAYEGQTLQVGGAKTVLRQAHQVALIDDIDGWFAMLEDRNRLSHAYDEQTVIATVDSIRSAYRGKLQTLVDTLEDRRGTA